MATATRDALLAVLPEDKSYALCSLCRKAYEPAPAKLTVEYWTPELRTLCPSSVTDAAATLTVASVGTAVSTAAICAILLALGTLCTVLAWVTAGLLLTAGFAGTLSLCTCFCVSCAATVTAVTAGSATVSLMAMTWAYGVVCEVASAVFQGGSSRAAPKDNIVYMENNPLSAAAMNIAAETGQTTHSMKSPGMLEVHSPRKSDVSQRSTASRIMAHDSRNDGIQLPGAPANGFAPVAPEANPLFATPDDLQSEPESAMSEAESVRGPSPSRTHSGIPADPPLLTTPGKAPVKAGRRTKLPQKPLPPPTAAVNANVLEMLDQHFRGSSGTPSLASNGDASRRNGSS